MHALLNSTAPLPTYNQLHGIGQHAAPLPTAGQPVGGAGQLNGTAADGTGAGAGGVGAEEEDNEYSHKYQPLDIRELSDAEKLFIEYGTNGQLEQMIDLYNKAKQPHSGARAGVAGSAAVPTTLSIDIDCCDQWGSTALMHASVRKHVSVMRWLCANGADINKQDYRGITVLMECCWNNKLEYVRMLLNNKLQYKQQLDINLLDERDYSALMQAAEEGHTSIVQLLLEYHADMNQQEKKRCYTALMWAVVEGHPSVVQLLVNAGADLNIQDKYGFTALMQAARTRFLAAVLLLVGNGADLDVKDKKNRNVYDLGNQQVLQAIDKGRRVG